jgi:hypothetical protein
MSLTIDVLVCPSIFTVGMIVQDFVHLPGGPAFSESNPIAAIYAIPVEGWVQILTAVSLVELATFKKTYTSGGDLGFNPLKLKADDSMRLKELKNGRLGKLISLVGESSFRNVVAHQFLTLSCLLAITSPIPAMIASIGLLFQCAVFKEGPISQLSHLGSVYQIPTM